jgi:hypothetical protein
MHQCPKNGCTEQVDDDKLACPKDWYSLPNDLRRLVYRTWQNGAGRGTPAHNRAVDQAVTAMNGGK